MNESEGERDKLIFELIRERFDQEWSRIGELDDKAANIIGFVGIIAGFLLGIESLILVQTPTLNALLVILYLLGIGFLMVSMILGLMAYRVRRWEVVPNVRVLIEEYTTKTHTEVLRRVAGETSLVVQQIKDQSNEKAGLIRRAWAFLILGLTTVLIYTATLILLAG